MADNRKPKKELLSNKSAFSSWNQVFFYARKAVLNPAILSGICVVGLIGIAHQLQLFTPLECSIYDYFVQVQPDLPPDDRLLIVAIDEDDLKNQNGQPLSDQTLAEVIQVLRDANARVIGLDLFRDISYPPGSEVLNQQLQANNVITIYEYETLRQASIAQPPSSSAQMRLEGQGIAPPAVAPLNQSGFNNLVVDHDGVVRRALLYVGNGKDVAQYSFALQLSLAYLGLPDTDVQVDESQSLLQLDGRPIPRLRSTTGGYQQADSSGYQILLRYRSPNQVAHQVSLKDVLNNQVNPGLINDKIVLIGVTAPSIKDLVQTPYSREFQLRRQDDFQMPGVLVHANLVSQILDAATMPGTLYRWIPNWAEWFWIVIWIGVGTSIIWFIRRPVWMGTVLLVGITGILAIGFISFSQMLWIPVAEPILVLMTAALVTFCWRYQYTLIRDELTNLANRQQFVLYLRRCLEQSSQTAGSQSLAVLMFDLDQFKLINESFGHNVGDAILRRLVQRIQKWLPSKSCFARVGSDEFAIAIFYRCTDDMIAFLQALQEVIKQPIQHHQFRLVLTSSIGLAFTKSTAYYDPEDVFRDAHTAMYRAKIIGREQYAVFATEMRQDSVRRLELEHELRFAIEQQQFSLYYQPIISLDTQKIEGFEALVRWQHPTKGIISPSDFIPIAEDTGLIIPLGEWVFLEACRQLRYWQSQLQIQQDYFISINLSSRQIQQSELLDRLQKILDQTHISGQYIRLEITESVAMKDVKAVVDFMLKVKSMGMKIAIDDFGTGYSSLSYLHRFPVDALKIDRSFVIEMEHSLENYVIARTIIKLGHTLGMTVVAEGVETEMQQSLLRLLGCDFLQGYLFAKPMSGSEATAFLQASTADEPGD